MLKTIATHQVVLGMYVHELKGAWVDHPFWKTKFILDDTKDLKKLNTSIIKQVVIDTDKGLDVELVKPDSQCEATLAIAVKATTTNPPVARVSMQQELKQATHIIQESKLAMASVFKDARLGKVIDTDHIMPLVDEIAHSIARNQSALISLLRLKTADDYTYMHSVAVCALMTALARQLDLSEPEIKQAGLAGLMHDLGKAAISLAILNKPGALTDAEFETIKAHPAKGHDLLLQANIEDSVTLDVCLHHHEKMDGSGYPHKLSNDQISIFAKMGAVCDVYDAITSDRPYKNGWEPGLSLQRMAQWENHFDATVFKAFVKSVGIYPVGTVVMLKSKRLAVVIDQSNTTLLKPIIKVFFSVQSRSRIPVETIDLSKAGVQDEIIGHETAANWGIEGVRELWAQQSV